MEIEIIKIEQLVDKKLISYRVKSTERKFFTQKLKKWYWPWPIDVSYYQDTLVDWGVKQALRLGPKEYRSYPDVQHDIPEYPIINEYNYVQYCDIQRKLENKFLSLELQQKYVDNKNVEAEVEIEILKSTPPKKCAYCLHEMTKIATVCLETGLSYHPSCYSEAKDPSAYSTNPNGS